MVQGKTSKEIVQPATKKSKPSEFQSDYLLQSENLSKKPAINTTIVADDAVEEKTENIAEKTATEEEQIKPTKTKTSKTLI